MPYVALPVSSVDIKLFFEVWVSPVNVYRIFYLSTYSLRA